MKKRGQDFALGLTAIIVFVVFLGTTLFLYPALLVGGERHVSFYFRHDEGMAPLKPGSAVILGGSLEVGQVRRVRIATMPDPRDAQAPPVTAFVVETNLRRDVPLYGDCDVTTDQPAIGGGGFVSIANVGTAAHPFHEPIWGRAPQSLSAAIGLLSRRLLAPGGVLDHLSDALDPGADQSVLRKILVSLDDVNAITAELRGQISPTAEQALVHKLHVILDDVNAATAALRAQLQPGDPEATLGKLRAALDQVQVGLTEATDMLRENRPLVRDALHSIEHLARTVDSEMLTTLRAQIDPNVSTSLLGKMHAAMDATNAALADVQAMTSAGDRLLTMSRPSLEKMLGNFQDVSEQLRQASLEVAVNPSILLWPPQAPRQERMLVFQAARNFAEAASALDDSTRRLEAVMSRAPDGRTLGPAETQELEAIRAQVKAAFQRFQRAQEVLWDQLK